MSSLYFTHVKSIEYLFNSWSSGTDRWFLGVGAPFFPLFYPLVILILQLVTLFYINRIWLPTSIQMLYKESVIRTKRSW